MNFSATSISILRNVDSKHRLVNRLNCNLKTIIVVTSLNYCLTNYESRNFSVFVINLTRTKSLSPISYCKMNSLKIFKRFQCIGCIS